MPHSLRSKICPLLLAGYPIPTIYKELKCSHHVVLRYARKLNLIPNKSLVPTYNWEEIQKYYDTGRSATECIKLFGFTKSTWTHAIKTKRIILDPKRSRNKARMHDMTGHKFGRFTVLKQVPKPETCSKNDTNRYWLCECECGNTRTVRTGDLKQKRYLSCGCSKRVQRREKSFNWKGYKELSGSFWNCMKRGAKRGKRTIPFDLTIEEAWDLFIKQNRKCAISGIELSMRPESKYGRKGTASLDRIDSSKGYTIDNVQWVHKDINIMKSDHTMLDFLKWINIIYKYQNKLHE